MKVPQYLAAVATLGLVCLGLFTTLAIRLPGGQPPCRTIINPDIACNQFTTPGECTHFAPCRPFFTICTITSAPTQCHLDGNFYPRAKTVGWWQLGQCAIFHRTCLVCGNGCRYMCAIEDLGTDINPLNGECTGRTCRTIHWAAEGQCKN